MSLYDYDEYEDYEGYDEYPDEALWLDEWEAPYPSNEGFSSLAVAGLMPMVAIGVSLVMLLVFLQYVFQRMPEIELLAVTPETQASVVFTSAVAPLFTPSVQYWASQITQWAEEWSLDPNLVATVMQIESCGNPQAISTAGASGLFQVMPFHFQTAEDPFLPDTNALRGMAYLSRALESFGGDVKMALAGYNAGITGASRGEALWPSETIRYTTWGIGIYEDAQTGKNESTTLNEWLSRGGAGLCNSAVNLLGIAP